jgi:hypothetical protein
MSTTMNTRSARAFVLAALLLGPAALAHHSLHRLAIEWADVSVAKAARRAEWIYSR